LGLGCKKVNISFYVFLHSIGNFLRLDTFQRASMPAQSAFDTQIQGADAVTLPENVACIEHCYFCGKDAGIRIHVNPANMTKLLGGAL
jgi:hypothetical protein